jgi:eukaryotic-like serine/threonine-protein kinase
VPVPEIAGQSLLHYRILRRIGEGGMGQVWLARDSKLEREVAIKILPADYLDHAARRERFLWEARAASALIHPNIVTIHEINSDQGLDFIVMEHVRGTSLADMLARTALDVRQALAYAIQIGDALAVAHAAGVAHRDLKPGNIMISDAGLIKVLDFGLAKRVTRSGSDDVTAQALTLQGVIMGTPAYMSPEQAVGSPVDARSDLFSFGVVLYQMLAGVRPFLGATSVTLLRQIVFGSPRPLRDISPALPGELCDLVDKCLAKEAANRPQDAATLVRTLRRLAAAIESDPAVAGSTPTIAIGDLPKPEPLAAAPQPVTPTGRRARMVAAGVLAVIVAAALFLGRPALDRFRGPDARAVDPVDATVGTPRELVQRARELLRRYDKAGNIDGAVAMLEAAVQRDPNFAPAYAALAQAYLRKGIGSSDKHWLNLADDAARRAVAANPDLAAAHEALGAVLVEKGEAARGREEIEQALKLDPRNPSAHILLAKLHAKSDPPTASRLYEQAIEFAPGEWIPQAEYGIFHYRNGRYREAIAAWEEAIRAAPDNVRLLNNLAAAYHALDDYERAASTLQAALNIDPSAATWNNLGTVRFFQGRYSDSVSAFENARQLDATNYQYWGNLGDGYRWAAGQREKSGPAYTEAIRLLRQRIDRNPDDGEARGRMALYLAKSGANGLAVDELNRLKAVNATGADASYKRAVTYEVLGQREHALTALGEAIRDGYSLRQIDSDPELASLRSDVRFHQVRTARPTQ